MVASPFDAPSCLPLRSFEFSDSTVKGEGELKILSRLLHPDSAVQPGDTHLVLGADSDLLLMALVSGQVRGPCRMVKCSE